MRLQIFWLVLGVLLLILAILGLIIAGGLDVEQNTEDSLQTGVLGLLSLGLAARS